MLLLVLANGTWVARLDQNVRRHQAGIGIEANAGIFAILASLFLELRHAVQPADPCNAVDDPAQLGMRRPWLWLKMICFFGSIPAAMKALPLPVSPAQFHRVLRQGDRMHIHHAIEAFVMMLKIHEPLDGPR